MQTVRSLERYVPSPKKDVCDLYMERKRSQQDVLLMFNKSVLSSSSVNPVVNQLLVTVKPPISGRAREQARFLLMAGVHLQEAVSNFEFANIL